MTQLSYLYTAAAFVVAGILAFATTPLAKKFAFLVGAVDEPRGRHAHEKPTALMGGIAIFWVCGVTFGVRQHGPADDEHFAGHAGYHRHQRVRRYL